MDRATGAQMTLRQRGFPILSQLAQKLPQGIVMKTLALRFALWFAILVMADRRGFCAATGPIPPDSDFPVFKGIPDHNIFDPNRAVEVDQIHETTPSLTVEAFALVGVMSYEKGSVAFFDGNSSALRKVTRTGDTISGSKVASITDKLVILT